MSERSRSGSSSGRSRVDRSSSQRNSNTSISQSKKNQFDPGGLKSDGGMDQEKTNLPPDKQHEEKILPEKTKDDSHRKNTQPVRLLLVSNKIKNHGPVVSAVLPHVKLVQYKYETVKLETIKTDISQALDGKKAASIACVLHTKPGTILLCSSGECREVLTSGNGSDNCSNVKEFFRYLTSNHLDKNLTGARIDFLACSALRPPEIGKLVPLFESVTQVPVGISKEILGTDIQMKGNPSLFNCVGEMYFEVEKLKNWSPQPQKLAGFERIRTVGKGAYGAAVLYRKKDDDSLVILKEINMHELNANERQMALNEIRVLSMLDHPNIISYYDSFEEEGTLMIEMEYADGGTLAQYLASNQGKSEMEEREILIMFQQMVSGIRHVHDHKILHRDLKTANIFLTKEGVIKIGDFGISKVLTSNNPGANTVLGTPYYISPEICEGKPYNDKSDIWALGCILYEMACRQKTFEGTNLPALVNKIMKGQFTPVKGNFSQEFKSLVQDMLQREPEYRPSANALHFNHIPMLMEKFIDPTTDVDDELATSTDSSHRKRTRSVLYQIDTSLPGIPPIPFKIELPSILKIRQVAVSSTHITLVTYERVVYSWGEGSKGQLGHGDLDPRKVPTSVEALKGKSITRVACGAGFSVFGSDNGIVMTCGDGSTGCLGHGDYHSASRPRLIETLLSVDVTSISCGPEHVVVVGVDGEIFSWGKGKDGRLGLGDEQDFCEPIEVTLRDPVFIQEVKCGVDGTMFLTDMGCLLACGSNAYNKLGLNHRQGFLASMKNMFTKTEVEGRKVPTAVKALSKFRVLDMVVGPHHSAVVVEPGLVYMFGRNQHGQLGFGNTKPREAPAQVQTMADKVISTVSCGEDYTVAGATDNFLYLWGKGWLTSDPGNDSTQSSLDLSQAKGQETNNGHRSLGSTGSLKIPMDVIMESTKDDVEKADSASPDSSTLSVATTPRAEVVKSAPVGGRQKRPDSTDSVFLPNGDKSAYSASPDARITVICADSVIACMQTATPQVWPKEEPITEQALQSAIKSGGSGGGHRRHMTSATSQMSNDSIERSELFLQPTPILKLGSESNDESYELSLSQVFCQGENIFVQLETSCPLPRKKSKRKRRNFLRKLSNNSLLNSADSTGQPSNLSNDAGDEYTSSEASELDTQGNIPTWLQKELKDSLDAAVDENDADDSEEDQGHPDETKTKDEKGAKQAVHHLNAKEIKAYFRALKDQSRKPDQITRRDSNTKRGFEGQNIPVLVKKASGEMQVITSPESGVDFKTDPASSDSGSELRQPKDRIPEEPTKQGKKFAYVATAAMHASKVSPYKQQKPPVPGAPRPLNRLRMARGRARTSSWTIEGLLKDNPKKPGEGSKEMKLQQELHRLQEEKEKTEAQLRKLEDEKKKQMEEIEEKANEAAKEREQILKGEISLLRNELVDQSHKMADNNKMMLNLQEQLMNLQSEQLRLSAREKRATSSVTPRGKQTSQQSKICTLS
ncbi:uncharacterized protein LOC121410305 isoform X1 [Lytechinus variegatus]|uniref:uncharacterized protein LOC121410305 isoform X1 n=1 Tax=Lytechinus variegatus TaxID=7654 RepID=UPI001BB25353|nr:uncharacterized protein LOC121410305 isoform X1 [Lytechinus variegatus]